MSFKPGEEIGFEKHKNDQKELGDLPTLFGTTEP
ncbi:unnamed protein product [uncultured virus]|nr:unnamed protein product [uncultured virus]